MVAPFRRPVVAMGFDVTPARYIAAIFTERGVARAPYTQSLAALAATREPALSALK